MATGVSEEAGRGAYGVVEGRRTTVGRPEPAAVVPDWARAAENRALLDGAAVAWLTVGGVPTGAVRFRHGITSRWFSSGV
ncbi:hypothetical protein [Streptomyces sp. NPDC018972]|uniref:hypothetical protein n=1 Tax=Streptomyces sp. NPDC018972 TaxID=3365060 RepID=UPI00379345B3